MALYDIITSLTIAYTANPAAPFLIEVKTCSHFDFDAVHESGIPQTDLSSVDIELGHGNSSLPLVNRRILTQIERPVN